MKRRFKHSVFVFAFAALVVGVFLPLVISASKRSAEWFSPRTVLAAPVDSRSSGVGSLLAAFRAGAGIHASLATNCTLYAAANGNDSNSGTSPSSPKTLQGAANATSPGSVVCLLAGRYELSQEFAPSISGTHSAWITYEAYNDGPPYLVWTGSKDSVPMIIIDGTKYPNIQNIAFQGLYLDGQGSALSGFQCKSANGINFIANTVVDTDGAGVVANGCDYVISDHNLIMHNGYSAGASNTSGISYGMVPWADSYTGVHNAISNNIIVGEVDQSATPTDGNGIILDLPYGSNTTTPPALILNNIVYGNGGRCIETNQYVTNFWIVNNSCYKNALNIPSQQTYPEIQQQLNTSMTGINGVIANNISYSWTSSNPPYEQDNPSSNPGITYTENLYFGGACKPSALCNGFINADPQFVTPPYFDPSASGQYAFGRPPLPGRPIYEPTTRCAVSGTSGWIPTCDIDSGFALASTSPGYGNIGVDPTTLTTNTNIQADLRTYVYNDINGNPRGGSTGKWDLGAYQH